MSHYVAELVEKADKAPPDVRSEAKRVCANAILELWQRLSRMPAEIRPLAELNVLVEVVASLAPDNPSPRYFQIADLAKDDASLADRVHTLDRAARTLLTEILTGSVAEITDTTSASLEAAADAEVDDENLKEAWEILKNLGVPLSLEPIEVSILRRRAEALEFLAESARGVAEGLKAQADELDTDS